MIVLLWFGVCAAILAATGVYSVIAEGMVARRSEIAIRNALGAPRHRLVRDMISRTLVFVALGEAFGAGTLFVVATFGSDLVFGVSLFGVSPGNPLILASVSTFLFLVSLGAALWPAWSAAGSDTKGALRAS
jgi:putative ABC transport system permease protein